MKPELRERVIKLISDPRVWASMVEDEEMDDIKLACTFCQVEVNGDHPEPAPMNTEHEADCELYALLVELGAAPDSPKAPPLQ